MFSPAQAQSFFGVLSPPVSTSTTSLPLQEPIPSASQLPPSTSAPVFTAPSKHIASSQYVDAHREVVDSLRKLYEHERQAWDIERKELLLKISELESSVYRLRVENGLLSPALADPKTGRSGSNSSLSPTSLSRSRSLHRDGTLSSLPTSTTSRAPRAVSATSSSRARDATSLPNIAEELEVKASVPPFERKKSVQFSSIDTRSHDSSSESVASMANGTKSPPMSFSPSTSTASAMACLPAIPGNLIDAKFDGISLKPSGLPVSVVQKVMPEAVQQVLSGTSTPLLSPRINITQSGGGSGNGTPPPTTSVPNFVSRARAPSLDVYESLPPEILKEGAAYKHYAGHTPLPKFDAAGLSTTTSSITSPKLDRKFSSGIQNEDVAASVDVKGNENAETALLASSVSTLGHQSESTANGFTTGTQLSSDGEGPLSPNTTMAAPTTTHPGAALSPIPATAKRPSERSESYFSTINGALSYHPVNTTNGRAAEEKDDGDKPLRGPLFLASEPDRAPPSNDAFLNALNRKLEKVAKHSPVDEDDADGEEKGEPEVKLRMKRSMNFGSVFGARV